MKKILILILLSLSGYFATAQYRSDVVSLANTSAITTYQGGSKILHVRDSTNGGFFYLYQGGSAVNGTTIIAGANSSKWQRMYASPQNFNVANAALYKITTVTGSSSLAPFNIPWPGANLTSISDGDFWIDPTDSSFNYRKGVTTLKWLYTIPLVFRNGVTVTDGTGLTADTVDIAGLADGDKGDITLSGSGTVYTIDNNAVTLGKLPNIATASIIGRVTAGTGAIEILTGTQATTLLDVFTSSLKGLVPNSGGGTTNFLRADGTWAAPGGGGSMAIGGTVTSGSVGSILFVASGPVLQQANGELFWDNTNKKLGVGTSSPDYPLTLYSATAATGIHIKGDGGGSYEEIKFENGFSGGGYWSLINLANTGSNNFVFSETGNVKFRLTSTLVSVEAGLKVQVTTSGAGTLNVVGTSIFYTFTGSTSTWTLPAVSGTTGQVYWIKNKGSGNITLNTTASANEIYTTAATNTVTISAGGTLHLISDGSHYCVVNN